MFFFFSIMPKNRLIESRDGWQIYESCSVFYLFFIPVFRWNKKYYVKRFNDDRMYEVSKQVVENQESLELYIQEEEENVCPCCGRTLELDYEFCPYCGTKL